MNNIEQQKNIKFDTSEIDEFFKYINDKETMNLIKSGYGILKLNGLNSFKNPEHIKKQIIGTKVNGITEFSAGDVYENYPRKARTLEERLDDVKIRVDKMVKHVQQLLNKNPKFSNIEISVVNKEIQLWRKPDQFDDGNDKYGSTIYLKFNFKK